MSTRSKALKQFLSEHGAVTGTPEAKALTREYRRIYKRLWKQKQLTLKIELRPSFTKMEFYDIKIAAGFTGLSPTAFVKESALAAISHAQIVPHKDTLLKVHQLVGLSLFQTLKHHQSYSNLSDAERILNQYLKENH